MQALRARLPRGAGQRRHRLRVPRRPLEDRVRPRRSDGRLDVRRLRRVRPGVPDRRADAGARRRARSSPTRQVDSVCPYCGVGCQLTYNIKDNTILYVQGKDGPANSSRLCVKGRYGFDYVQHRHRLTKPLIRKPGVPKHKDFVVDPDNWREVFREATLGRSARRRREGPARHPRHVRQAIARRLRLGEGHQRGGLSVPEAGAHRLRLEQRRSLHASVPRVERRRADGRHQLRRGVEPGARRRERRSDLRHRRQPHGEPSGRRDLDEERRQGRREADRRRSAPQRSRAARDLLPAVQSRHRRRAAQRDAARHRRGGARRRGVHPRSHLGIRRARREREEVLAGSDGADLRHRRARRSARSPGCTRRRRAR